MVVDSNSGELYPERFEFWNRRFGSTLHSHNLDSDLVSQLKTKKDSYNSYVRRCAHS